MPETTPGSEGHEPGDPVEGPDAAPTFSESLSAAARQSGFAQLKPGETPTGSAVLKAVGGIRGILESVLPGIAFLVLYLTTSNLLVAVLVPVLVVFIFAVARAGQRSSFTSTVAGGVLLAISAVLVLATGKATANFVPGIFINAAGFVVMLVSIVVGWPLIGVIVGLLYGQLEEWRHDPAKRRTLTLATWLWVALFAIRLALELPLYFANDVTALAIVRLITSVPLYALFLWATWLLVRGVYAGEKVGGSPPESSENVLDDSTDEGESR